MTKKNIRTIPKFIYKQLECLNDRFIIVACLRIYPHQLLKQGILKHLNIILDNEGLSVPEEEILPPESSGKYSSRNINGYEEIRKDLPKETHYNSIESPNWGDLYNGTHIVQLPYEKYPRDFHGPEYLRLKINAKNNEPDQKEYVLMFEVNQVIDRESPNFEDELLKCLNIMQENIGSCGVQKSGASLSDYLKTIQVTWEILPPGTRDEVIERIFLKRKATSEEDKKTAGERYDFFNKLKPKKLIFGSSGLQRYFGALLEENLVIFENIEYGNAIYILFDNWQELSKRTRTELLSGRYGDKFQRIRHIAGWKQKVKAFVKSHREDKV